MRAAIYGLAHYQLREYCPGEAGTSAAIPSRADAAGFIRRRWSLEAQNERSAAETSAPSYRSSSSQRMSVSCEALNAGSARNVVTGAYIH